MTSGIVKMTNNPFVILNLFQENRRRHCVISNRRAYTDPKEKAGAALAAPAPFLPDEFRILEFVLHRCTVKAWWRRITRNAAKLRN
jgi:hypothetical protein